MPASDNRRARSASGAKAVEDMAKIEEAFRKRDEKVLVKRLSHVSIVVRDIYQALSAFDKFFQFVRQVQVETIPEQGVKVAIISLEGTDIEFVQPIEPDTGVAKFLEHRGEGLHHISFEVNDIDETLKNVGSKGAKLIDREPWPGVRGRTSLS